MHIKFCCPKCDKAFSVSNEHAGRKGKCPCGAIIIVPGHKTGKAVTYIIDDKHSQLPFFLVYRIAETSMLESSIRRVMASNSESILAKLFFTAPVLQQMIFTNKRIIVLSVISSRWDRHWRKMEMLKNIPVIDLFMDIFLALIKDPLIRLFKIDYLHVYQLNAVDDKAILSVKKAPKNIDKKIIVSSLPYTKIVQPSLGMMIQRRWFAFRLTKIRGTTLRFIPVGRLRSVVNGFLDAADYLLPNRLSVDKLVPVLKALKPHLPSDDISLIEKKDLVSFRWPADIGIGDSFRSVRRLKVLTIVLVLITLFLFVVPFAAQEAWLFLLPVLFADITLRTLLVRRFEQAVITIILIAVIIIVTFIQILVENI